MTLHLLNTTRHSRTNSLDMELLSPSPFNSLQVTYITKDYLPRDKVTKEHIISIIGARSKNDHVMINLEMGKCQLMKSKFLRYSRHEIVQGYVKVAGNMGWKLNGQQITRMAEVYEYIQMHEWNEKLQKELHFLQYKRFKVDALFVRWDKTIAETFCKNHNIMIKDDDATEQSVTEKKRRGITRECFLTLASMVKNDYNKKLRMSCEKAHGASIKERADTAQVKDGKVNRGVIRHFAYTDDFVRRVKICDDATHEKREIEKLKADNKKLKAEVTSLRQDKSDAFSDFVFESTDDFTVSVIMLFLLIIISYYLIYALICLNYTHLH